MMNRLLILLPVVVAGLTCFSGCLTPWPGNGGQNTALVYQKPIRLVVTNPDGESLTDATLSAGDEDAVSISTDPVVITEGTMYTLDAGNLYREIRFRIDTGLTNLHTLRISLDHVIWPNKSCYDEGRKLKGNLYSENGAVVEGGIIRIEDRVANTDEEGRYNRCFPVHYDQSQSVFIAKSATSSYRMGMTLVKNGDTDTLLDVFLDDSTDMIDPK
ncbi:MAG: hypothetical protein J5I41_09200 [Saprospiraceae bacterium]|nr:hypothetical protein [Saprospiraceae bacterium]